MRTGWRGWTARVAAAAIGAAVAYGCTTPGPGGTDSLTAPVEATRAAAAWAATPPALARAAAAVRYPLVRIQPHDTTLAVGGSVTLSATITLADGNAHTGLHIIWTSSNTAVLSIGRGSSPVVTGKSAGTATVTARDLSGTTGTLTIAVGTTPPPPPPARVASVAVAPASASLSVGQTDHLTATAKDSAGTVIAGAAITWGSSAPADASVSSTGLVTAVAVGSAAITATSNGHSGSSAITVTKAVTPPPPPPGTWNLPAGWTVVCQTGAVTSASAGFSMPSGGAINFGGPVPCAWTRNGGNGTIGLASAASNPDGSANTDVQSSGYRVMFPAGQVNDPGWDMYFYHAVGTGSYYIGWKQRWQPRGSYASLLSALNSGDSKAWAPKGPSGGDLTIMSFMGFNSVPVIGLDFQGVDDHAIPDVNQTGASGTMPVTGAMTLPGVAAGNGAWDQEEVIIRSTGAQSSSTVSLYVNGALVGTATGVTNASAWNATEQYLSRSIYGGTENSTTYTDIDQVTVAVH